ncbi:envelope biogenesis factor ElyC [Edwardsiella piscicida]|uniref:envelope biogenesis factor ElyC n=1 Tax=Edwardsiella piscicida TaxID=1263550 RepID=UPI002478CFDF|nr:envelope biogenesis factor ElyC [Edwardsiella piscicida]EKS7792379.1 envelope biogenesis factor ElyC [Edwardsiella piscicida]ELM3729855.1 envelope biogenesis factor ElyC [Edwardsiella piscicida]ELM3737182.1 envelope biogenesis factor ElyC [Edwardsiella piscicida]ELV7536128.1 envelope biogenesis factor ElyC [Edwardsiella piscicida]WGS75823.1 envelope biogenesis factor ElyC [Edwardsiella piscicida]
MLFELKKFVGMLLLPLPLLLSLCALGLALLWLTRRQRTGKVLVSLAWLGILLLSMQPLADRLLAPLEDRYPTLNGPHQARYVVVLGGGYTYNPQWAPSSNLIGNSLPRVTEGIRQLALNPQARLIVTGAAAQGNPVSSAEVAARVARSLGVDEQRIIVLDSPRDTGQEAQAVADVVGNAPLILVTSANHMPRALGFFHHQGLDPIPAPANQLAIASPLNPWERWLPSPLYLGHSERAWYETLGRLWQGLTGQAQDRRPAAPTEEK